MVQCSGCLLGRSETLGTALQHETRFRPVRFHSLWTARKRKGFSFKKRFRGSAPAPLPIGAKLEADTRVLQDRGWSEPRTVETHFRANRCALTVAASVRARVCGQESLYPTDKACHRWLIMQHDVIRGIRLHQPSIRNCRRQVPTQETSPPTGGLSCTSYPRTGDFRVGIDGAVTDIRSRRPPGAGHPRCHEARRDGRPAIGTGRPSYSRAEPAAPRRNRRCRPRP